MIKNNKWKLIISSIIILLPMLVGLLAERLLPERIIVHWGFDGNPDGWASPTKIFLILPLVLLAVHWICMLVSAAIDKNQPQNNKMVKLTFWIIPFISLTCHGVMLATAMGHTANVQAFVYLILGVAFVVIGNYMPKTTRNPSMGIKIKWTMSNDENWNATHRFAGKLYVVMGFVCLLAMPLPQNVFPVVAIALILVCIVTPTVYSYRFYKKQLADGRATKEDYERGYVEVIKNKKLFIIITVVIVIVLAVLLCVTMFTGDIDATLGDTSMTVKASFTDDLTLNYEDIDAIEYREEGVDGQRIYGFGSARLLLGTFSNEEFGAYTRYTYTGDDPCVVLTVGEEKVVIGLKNEQQLRWIYDRISAEVAE